MDAGSEAYVNPLVGWQHSIVFKYMFRDFGFASNSFSLSLYNYGIDLGNKQEP
jgi:hypothetical protein